MTSTAYTEDTLVQQTTAEYLERELGWKSVYAYNNETFLTNPHPGPLPGGEGGLTNPRPGPLPGGEGVLTNPRPGPLPGVEGESLPEGKVCLGRESDREVVLTRSLRAKLMELNPGLPGEAYEDAVRQITAVSAAQTLTATNREKYNLLRDGVRVTFRDEKGARVRQRLRIFDFAKEAANENDETRKRFELMSRIVFTKFKACLTIDGINEYRNDYSAINVVYKSLQQDREKADISDIIQQLHQVVDDAIETKPNEIGDTLGAYDISKINFERLRQEFSRSPAKRTTVQNLKTAIESRLRRLLLQNPLRTDFQKHYEQIVAEYNSEKDRATIEKTFEALLREFGKMSEEENRAAREGLDEESLAVFDLLRKPDLSPNEIKRIKAVAVELLGKLKAEKLSVDHWRDKEATRDAVRLTIRDFLWSDSTGLPVGQYSEDEVQSRADEVFQHFYRAYPTLPSPFYQSQVA